MDFGIDRAAGRLFPHNPQQPVLRDEWREDLFYYLVSSLFIQILTYLTLAPSNFIVHNQELGAVRAFHVVPFLWRFHAVHHSAKSMDWIAGARMHFAEVIILRSVTATPMLVIGFDESAIQAYTLLIYIYSTFIHSNVRGDFGVLENILVFPRFHHWHHGIDKDAID